MNTLTIFWAQFLLWFYHYAFQSHFSIKKGAAALGIGTESVICIKADERLVWIVTTEALLHDWTTEKCVS